MSSRQRTADDRTVERLDWQFLHPLHKCLTDCVRVAENVAELGQAGVANRARQQFDGQPKHQHKTIMAVLRYNASLHACRRVQACPTS